MKYSQIHEFNLDNKGMRDIQTQLSQKVEQVPLERKMKIISGVDIAYDKNKAYVAIITINRKDGSIIDIVETYSKVTLPYIPGYLAFRELPPILEAWSKLTIEPDLVFFDGNGIIHPRRCGLACHASFFINKPTVGVAKKLLLGEFETLDKRKGCSRFIYHKHELIGAAVRTKDNVKPVFVSVGNWITLREAIKLTLELAGKRRLPNVIHLADTKSKKLKMRTKI